MNLPENISTPSALSPELSYIRGMERLVSAVQDLSLARDFETIQEIVRHAARELTGADGATFVLRDGDLCYYADEDAIGPLWKGKRFPMTACISGWSMMNKKPAIIEDIYTDTRIPVEAYRPTFVQSLAMVPIRSTAPIGAIGNYWAKRHIATTQEIKLLQALADSTSVAIDSVLLYNQLEQRVYERTASLESINRELEAFSHSVSHDLRAPLRAIDRCRAEIMLRCANTMDSESRDFLERIQGTVRKMTLLIDNLLSLSRVARAEMRFVEIDLSKIAREILNDLQQASPERMVNLHVPDQMIVHGDAGLLRIALENLLSNAWKFTRRTPIPHITVGLGQENGKIIYFVEDNGAGFDPALSHKLFAAFQRLHDAGDFEGTGIGLATVQRIIKRHDGEIWGTGDLGKGAKFCFTLCETPS